MSAELERAFAAARRAANEERRDVGQAAYEVGFEKGFHAGWEAAEGRAEHPATGESAVTDETYPTIDDVPADVMEVKDRDGTKWHRGPGRPDWWWAEWDDGEGPSTSDELDGWRPFTRVRPSR